MAKKNEPLRELGQRKPEYPPSNKPYVAYEITGTGRFDRGLGISMQRAVHVYCQNQGFAATASLETESDYFRIVLQIVDNGKADFNMRAFREHLLNSGRQPQEAKHRAERIVVRPIPREETVSIVQEDKSQVGWEKTVQSLNERLIGKDEAIASYKKIVSDNERDISALRQEKEALEKRLSSASRLPTHHDNAVSAVIHGYVSGNLETLLDVSADFERILTDNERIVMLMHGENKGFVDYINARTGMGFDAVKDFEQWRDYIASHQLWETTTDGKAYSAKKGSIDADSRALASIEKTASPEAVSALRDVIDKKQEAFNDSQADYEKRRERFAAEALVYKEIENADLFGEFKTFEEVRRASEVRRESNSQIPLLVAYSSGNPNDLLLYLPVVDGVGKFEKYLHRAIAESFTPEKYNVSFSESSSADDICMISITAPETRNKRNAVRLQRKVASLAEKLEKDSILNALGMKIRVTGMAEFV